MILSMNPKIIYSLKNDRKGIVPNRQNIFDLAKSICSTKWMIFYAYIAFIIIGLVRFKLFFNLMDRLALFKGTMEKRVTLQVLGR